MLPICDDLYKFSILLCYKLLKKVLCVFMFVPESHVSQTGLKHIDVAREDLELQCHHTWSFGLFSTGMKFRALCMLGKHYVNCTLAITSVQKVL